MPFWGFGIVKSVDHARSSKRDLSNAIHHPWHRNANRFVDCWSDIHEVVPLAANFPQCLNPGRPAYKEAGTGAAEMTGHLFGPLKWAIQRPSPAHRKVILMQGAPNFVDRLEHRLHIVGKAVLGCHVVER